MSDAPPPGWGQPQGPPSGQGYPAQPPGGHGAPPPPPPGPPAFGQAPIAGSLPASGRPYDGEPGPPPKGKGGLIAIIALVLIVVLGGIGIVLMLRAGSADPDPVATSAEGARPAATAPAASDQAAGAQPSPGPSAEPAAPTDGTAPDAPPATSASPGAQPSDPQAPAPQGTDQSVFELAIGTCFDDPASQSEIQSVTQIPCDAPHDNEVFGLVEFPAGADDPFPGREVIAEYGDEQCQGPVFVDYVGIDYNSSRYYASQLTPTEGSWEQGDREIVCILYDNLDQITGSVRGSAQ